jgi:hypothetical protein
MCLKTPAGVDILAVLLLFAASDDLFNISRVVTLSLLIIGEDDGVFTCGSRRTNCLDVEHVT